MVSLIIGSEGGRSVRMQATQTVTGLTGPASTSTFTLANFASPGRVRPWAAGAQSNAIALTPLIG